MSWASGLDQLLLLLKQIISTSFGAEQKAYEGNFLDQMNGRRSAGLTAIWNSIFEFLKYCSSCEKVKSEAAGIRYRRVHREEDYVAEKTTITVS